MGPLHWAPKSWIKKEEETEQGKQEDKNRKKNTPKRLRSKQSREDRNKKCAAKRK